MDISQAIRGIRVVRSFGERPLTEAQIESIVNAGRRAGSSKNLQRWAFIVVRERERLGLLSAAGPFAGHVAGAAAAIALVTPDPKADDAPLSIMFDLGRAAQNMVLTAWDQGIGSCPATVYQQDIVRQTLQLPTGMHCEYILSLGHPSDARDLTEQARTGGRVALADVLHHETW